MKAAYIILHAHGALHHDWKGTDMWLTIYVFSKSIDNFDPQEFRDLLELNSVSYFMVAKHTLPYLRLSHGNIICISSLVSSLGQQGAVTYCATKVVATNLIDLKDPEKIPQQSRLGTLMATS